MSKTLGSWSGMRRYLEKEMLAPCLQGKIRYGCTSYTGMDGARVFDVFIDDKQIKRFSWETVNTYFIRQGCKTIEDPVGKSEYWHEFWTLLDKYSLSERTEYTDGEFCDALEQYRNQGIQESICSENAIVRMFAVLDRRVGKRTLMRIKETVPMQPEWLQKFYLLRLTAELLQ